MDEEGGEVIRGRVTTPKATRPPFQKKITKLLIEDLLS